MAKKPTPHDPAIDRRRLRVSQLLTQQKTQREICDLLAADGFINNETGEPWSLGTVNADVKYLRAEWRRSAAREIHDHKAEILAELDAVKRRSWELDDMRTIVRTLAVQARVLGLDKGIETGEDLDFTITIKREPSRTEMPQLGAGEPSIN